MENMKYNVGDKVLIKTLDWYNMNKDKHGYVPCGEYYFVPQMSVFCGKILTIFVDFEDGTYLMKEDTDSFVFTTEMIEGLVEETITINEQLLTPSNISLEKEMEWTLPEGYIFKDENGNEILTSKIILEKKKKEVTYPKTYEECCKVIGYALEGETIIGYKAPLLRSLQKLLICRDAYWKISGDEMGLGKPWENGRCEVVYSIFRDYNDIVKQDDYWGGAHIFEFPTREMRDAFENNFGPDLEICKEFL